MDNFLTILNLLSLKFMSYEETHTNILGKKDLSNPVQVNVAHRQGFPEFFPLIFDSGSDYDF